MFFSSSRPPESRLHRLIGLMMLLSDDLPVRSNQRTFYVSLSFFHLFSPHLHLFETVSSLNK